MTATAKRPSWSSDDLIHQLKRYDRAPFLELLAMWFECAPSVEAVQSFALKKPDLWVKALSDLAKMSGFTEKQEVLHTHRVDQLSDSQLEDRAIALANKLGLPLPQRGQIIEAEVISENNK